MIEFRALILIGAVLFAAGLFAGAKLRGRWRLWVTLPVILLIGLVVYLALGIREDHRLAQEIFSSLDVETDLTADEANALRKLRTSSRRVREATLRLAFSNPAKAGIAL